MTTDLPEFDPHLLARQIAVNKEFLRRNLITEEEYNERDDRIHNEHYERHAQYVAAAYKNFNIPQLEKESHQAMVRQEQHKLARSRHWYYSWKLPPTENLFDLASLLPDDPETVRAKNRKHAALDIARLHGLPPQPLQWLWPGRLPVGKVSLLTGDAGEGKSLVAGDLIGRVTAGRDWPDGAAGQEPGEVLLITPEAGLLNVISPRLQAVGADLLRVHLLSSVSWNDPRTGVADGEPFRLPDDGPAFENFLAQRPNLRLVVIDPLSEFLALPSAAAERPSALHDVLMDLEDVAEAHGFAILCVESARRGGLVGTPSRQQWRAHYDAVFQSVWGVARDPRDRNRRLLLPIRHHLGDDRTGLQFTITPHECGAARIEWGDPEDSITYAEATGRVRLGRGIWSFSQTAQAEAWLRVYLKDGEKPSVEIFSDAREQGFTENPVRDALRRVASKYKQGFRGTWIWKLKET